MDRPRQSSERRLKPLIELYLLRCEVEGMSPRTTCAYGETLRRFLRVAREERFPENVDEIETAHLYAYLGRYIGHSHGTRHRYFREVRCFFNWLAESGVLDQNPFGSIRNVRLPQKIVQPFSREEIVRLLDSCDAETQVGLRDRAMLMVLLDTGIRCSELVSLNLADLDLHTGRLRILQGKGNKQRVVSFADRCAGVLRQYLEVRDSEEGPLFLAVHGRWLRPGVALLPNGLKQMLRRLARKSGVAKVHAHRFRHTFATWALEQDARELDVQHLLGHTSLDMVRRYSSTYNSEQAARRHASFSPGERLPASAAPRLIPTAARPE